MYTLIVNKIGAKSATSPRPKPPAPPKAATLKRKARDDGTAGQKKKKKKKTALPLDQLQLNS
eukprot:7381789-Prymnesium_polylepis.1